MGVLRHPKTFGEMRENQEGFCRPRRSPKNLPNVYWDIFVNRDDRSWKRFRKTRWKVSS
jgi:hypothetical protein